MIYPFFSLQFLSMKLATVNPELNIDLERILSKDVSYSSNNNWKVPPYMGSNMNSYSPSCLDSCTRCKCRGSRIWSRDKLLSPFPPWYLSGNNFRHPKYKSTFPSLTSGFKIISEPFFITSCLSKILFQHIFFFRLQTVLDNEFQNLFQMGFDSSSAMDSFGPNGILFKYWS